MSEPVVLQLQADCISAGVPISTLLRKAKLIASKLRLTDTTDWLEQELNGYSGPWKDIPSYRIGTGMPKYFNPYHGWLDIVLSDPRTNTAVSTCHLPQSIAEIEHLSSKGSNGFVILGFPAPIADFLHNSINIEFNCGLHLSTAVLIGVIEGVRNTVLDWTLNLEQQGIMGEGLSFSKTEIERAQMVTNHIYNSNVGVVGQVLGDASMAHFQTSSGELDQQKLTELASQIRAASGGLPEGVGKAVLKPVAELEKAATTGDKNRVTTAFASIRSVLEGASGNLAAAGILSALGAG